MSEDEAKVDTGSPDRGRMLLIPGRRHALTIDSGWREVADTALAFTQWFSELRPARTGIASS